MPDSAPLPKPSWFIATVKDRCRVCYGCIRGCPAKAIRIQDHQATVMPDRCIGCGNCVRVCSRGAKQIVDTTTRVEALLAGSDPVAVLVAPSMAAEFCDQEDTTRMVGTLRKVGFKYVFEVGFGADLVAARYRALVERREPGDRYIASTCPAVVGYVERYHPDLVPRLSPIVSPMVTMARVARRLHGPATRVVFLGPCVAKKMEAVESAGEVDAAITFAELRLLLAKNGSRFDDCESSDFDPPHAGSGSLFPLNRGLLQAAGLVEDLSSSDVLSADPGPRALVETMAEFSSGDMDTGLLEVLCCNGCIGGPGMTTHERIHRRRSRVAEHARRTVLTRSRDQWNQAMASFDDLDLSRTFHSFDQRSAEPSEGEIRHTLGEMGKRSLSDELNCRACGYPSCRDHAVAILRGLAEGEMCLPHVIERLNRTVFQLSEANRQIQSTQDQLMHSERLASMGQLAAGVAHEINNPLGVVLLYSHLLRDEIGPDSPFAADLDRISDHASRCKRIVSDLLDFARENRVMAMETDVPALIRKSLGSVPRAEGIQVVLAFDEEAKECELDAAQMIQVFTNLFGNAFEAMGQTGTLTVRTRLKDGSVQIFVRDTGRGIPAANLKKIFQPFFTTKQMGSGTGLGLAVVYGIVKMHRGTLQVDSNSESALGLTYTEFQLSLPRFQTAMRTGE